MKETEAKILEVDAQDVCKRLEALGAQKVFEGELVATVYDFPDKRLSKQEILIRLRKEGNNTKLTYKKLLNADQAKVSEEIEVAVGDFDAMEKILLLLGLSPKKGYPLSKQRLSYVLDSTRFELDTFTQFPTYLEIEAPDDATIKKYAQKLGFTAASLKPWGVREVFAHYRNKK